MSRAKVGQLPFGETTSEGAFYPIVDGEKVGENGRCFFQTRESAYDCAVRVLRKKTISAA